jgi:hypothetical protein
MIRTPFLIASLAAASFLLGACGDDDPTTTSAAGDADEQPADDGIDGNDDTVSSVPPDNGAAGGTCLEGSTEPCDDMGAPADNDEGAARSLLGVAKEDLADDVRIARIDDEQFALTEDYRIGRITVELDTDADGVARVTVVTIELEDGPVTVRA